MRDKPASPPPPRLCQSPHHAPQAATPRATERLSATLSRLTTRHTRRHGASQHAPRARTPQARERHSTRYRKGHRKPGNATPAATGRHSSAPFRARCPHSRGQPVDNLLITCGKPLLARGYEDGVVDNSTTYPHVIHRLSTGYPQVKTSHAMRGLLT